MFMVDFRKQYLEFKKKERLTDRDIAEKLYISYSSLVKYKRLCGLNGFIRCRRSKLPFTEQQLQAGEKIGLTRRIMYQRVREHGWSCEEACSVKNIGVGKRRK